MATPAILLVCAANRCRSPLAAALLRRLLQDAQPDVAWCIESAGLYALSGLPATAHVQAVASEAQLDLSQHRARAVDQVQLARYELILTMEEVQAEALVSAFPLLAEKIRPLSVLVNLRVDIEDPTGGGLREHRALVELLLRYLEAGLPQLCRLIGVAK